MADGEVSTYSQEMEAISKLLNDNLAELALVETEELHLVMVPYPLQGHINPMMQMAHTIIAKHCVRVSFINIKHHHDRMQHTLSQYLSSSKAHDSMNTTTATNAQHEDKLQLLWVDNGLPSDFDYKDLTFKMRDFHLSTLNMKEPLKQLLQSLNKKSPPISCVLFGSFCPWVHTIAVELEIPSVFFWTQSAAALSMYYHAPLLAANGFFPYKKQPPSDCNDDDQNVKAHEEMVSYVPGVPPLHPSSFPTLLHLDSISNPMFSVLREQFTILPSCQGIIVNTFQELEEDAYRALQEELPFPVSLVGPLIPSALLNEGDADGGSLGATSSLLVQEKNECLEWLNGKKKHSVLYISFGTLFNLCVEDLDSIANGIKASRQPFLWVIRPTSSHLNVADMLPKGFIDDTKEYGIIIPWAPQVQVLSHPSIGAFLTHCGWNSTLESVSMGVPMIPCPIKSDQPTNCTFVCELWKVGIALKRHGDGSIRSLEVERVVRLVLETKEGDAMRRRAMELRDVARKAAQAQGSSCIHLEKFMQNLR